MVGPLTVSLGLGLADTCIICDSDARYSARMVLVWV